ncbi:hypothetical protein GSI_12396 [Ganoderma sinense ZZ0214-1]|uniref:Uncharacterized protein n=1 Tax=Ganoderma sinense ZZ0214-1 TaxID=1077348 RepID=A0A2G8RVK1_9APHY|nr:hypothetical protein GSI_12396 [Ganoderma sinense ZZ0214-1]
MCRLTDAIARRRVLPVPPAQPRLGFPGLQFSSHPASDPSRQSGISQAVDHGARSIPNDDRRTTSPPALDRELHLREPVRPALPHDPAEHIPIPQIIHPPHALRLLERLRAREVSAPPCVRRRHLVHPPRAQPHPVALPDPPLHRPIYRHEHVVHRDGGVRGLARGHREEGGALARAFARGRVLLEGHGPVGQQVALDRHAVHGRVRRGLEQLVERERGAGRLPEGRDALRVEGVQREVEEESWGPPRSRRSGAGGSARCAGRRAGRLEGRLEGRPWSGRSPRRAGGDRCRSVVSGG